MGKLATYTISFPLNAPTINYTFALSGIQGVTSSGLPLTLVVGPAVNVQLLSVLDINSDGLVNYLDVNLMVDQVNGLTPCNDVTGDGKCDLADIQAIINKGLGL